jgi:hypothetical protein
LETEYILSSPVYAERPEGLAPYPGMPVEPRERNIEERYSRDWSRYRETLQEDMDADSSMISKLSSNGRSLIESIQSILSKVPLPSMSSALGGARSFFSTAGSNDVHHPSEHNPRHDEQESTFKKVLKAGPRNLRERLQKARMPDMTFREEDWDYDINKGYTRREPSPKQRKHELDARNIFQRQRKRKDKGQTWLDHSEAY